MIRRRHSDSSRSTNPAWAKRGSSLFGLALNRRRPKQSIELAAIDWTVVHSLWAVEKREQAKQVHPKRDRRGHSTAKKYDGDTSSVSSDTGGVVAVKRPRLVESDERSLEGADWPPVGTLVEVLLDDGAARPPTH